MESSAFAVGTPTTQKGFSLIEILLAIILFGLLTGAGVANYYKLNKRKLVEGASRKVETALRDTQKQASAGVIPSGFCPSPNTLDSYSVRFGSGGTDDTWEIRAHCSDTSSAVTQTNTLPEGTRFSLERFVFFKVLGETLDFGQLVCVEDDAGDLIYNISIDQGGAVDFLGETGACDPGLEVVLNSASGKTCNTACADIGKSCSGISTNPLGANGRYRRRGFFGACQTPVGTCGTTMIDQVGSNCSGIPIYGTYCRCL